MQIHDICCMLSSQIYGIGVYSAWSLILIYFYTHVYIWPRFQEVLYIGYGPKLGWGLEVAASTAAFLRKATQSITWQVMMVKWSYLNLQNSNLSHFSISEWRSEFFRNSGWSFPPIEVIASTRNHSKIRCDMVWRYPPDFFGHAAFKQGQAATVTSILLATSFEAEILRSALRAGHKIKEDSDEILLPILVC